MDGKRMEFRKYKPARRSSLLRGSLLVVALLGSAAPVLAQTAPADGEARLRKIEAEVRALQRQVFPGSDGKFFTPEVSRPATPTPVPGAPASPPVSDLLARMDAVESQLTRLTAQNEETANRVAQLEAKMAALSAPPTAAAATGALPDMAAAATAPAAAVAVAAAPKPAAVERPAPAPKPVAARPSVQRVAAVEKIEKPATGNAADDEYTYGFRLWEAKFYPEAQQQLQLYVTKYPRDTKISMGRNLLGRAYLDDGKAREAGAWFVKNYQTDKAGTRAPDSLLNLAEAMRQLKDTNRACIALAEFGEVYPKEAAGRLRGQFEALRSQVKCD